jgi:hypothetical protein
LLNILFELLIYQALILSTFLLVLDLFVTTSLHLKDSLVVLGLFRFLCILASNFSSDFRITSNQIFSDVSFTSSGDSSTVIMFVYVNTVLGKIELCAANLFFCLLLRVKSELLSHFYNDNFTLVLVSEVIIVN